MFVLIRRGAINNLLILLFFQHSLCIGLTTDDKAQIKNQPLPPKNAEDLTVYVLLKNCGKLLALCAEVKYDQPFQHSFVILS